MIRFAMFAALIAAPGFSLAAETETATTGPSIVAQAQTTTVQSAPTFNQTYDPASAFDGYWYPARRAIDGQEDR